MAPLKLKFWDALDPKQKQWALLALLLGAGFTMLWAIFALTEKPKPSLSQSAGLPGRERVTNVGVMAPGQQVNPLDSWLGGAGKDVAQLKQDRDATLSCRFGAVWIYEASHEKKCCEQCTHPVCFHPEFSLVKSCGLWFDPSGRAFRGN